jgi:hypothetical protein
MKPNKKIQLNKETLYALNAMDASDVNAAAPGSNNTTVTLTLTITLTIELTVSHVYSRCGRECPNGTSEGTACPTHCQV